MTATPFVRKWLDRNDTDALHVEGARRFGVRWMQMNKNVINLARKYGLDPTRHAPFLSDIAFEICEREERASPSPDSPREATA